MGIRNRGKFTSEFRREAVRLTYESGKTSKEVAKDLGIGHSTLDRWRSLYGPKLDMQTEAASLKEAQEEIKRLRRELMTVTQEREILKKAQLGTLA